MAIRPQVAPLIALVSLTADLSRCQGASGQSAGASMWSCLGSKEV